jgi:hypothetical protein
VLLVHVPQFSSVNFARSRSDQSMGNQILDFFRLTPKLFCIVPFIFCVERKALYLHILHVLSFSVRVESSDRTFVALHDCDDDFVSWHQRMCANTKEKSGNAFKGGFWPDNDGI